MQTLTLLIFLMSFKAYAALPNLIQGKNIINNQLISLQTKQTDKKALVVLFLSAKCPCSNSHVKIIKKLVAEYPQFKFVAVHSNLDESTKETQKYFKSMAFNFEVIEDNNSQLADVFQAFKTPHAFVISSNGQILYQGGVTNSSHADSADRIFLAEALSDISQNKTVRTPEGRTLGCVILRANEIVK